MRLAFDLHDGALQDLAALAIELQLFRTQMAANADRLVLGHVDDFAARVGAIESDLRTLAHSLSAPALTARPWRRSFSPGSTRSCLPAYA